ncbi:SURF1 family protein (macronuclear) [Tetrahymena thermophila SB210]|uniref:SURF1-like protein n=1 Tax=Tetrahymena thermophila (strain SB210) TaxID=312017 RepID=I7M1Q4_TETTS|nr:SURF1 family protein [Tetrahymena thermophila SB210]7W5Z_D Chain D, SURF1-like protein [Tetrahymena thermophila]7W5Z_d Chain d, SURF1-like protein [Tetrahymena thermophila]8B6H_DP Chain DP, SURF1-like protein [Tetrahymena thermophila SB210]8B6H_Dp Chain Dp, SURF1-like protein [Tetrahymena thermophila SB210]8BQS_DP Chain DP, SURF1-like protein [Tetrahymena thermophila SB210]8BQS_Dp Chain Dp, SURF1-like protein [Tetrahymena thermophila SB210]8GYM_D Chain D, SURF1-like protein [Tetrahymena t|eukprot:XP_001017592.2 SURF1 family protein [Tetrahymena thermophila SB210]
MYEGRWKMVNQIKQDVQNDIELILRQMNERIHAMKKKKYNELKGKIKQKCIDLLIDYAKQKIGKKNKIKKEGNNIRHNKQKKLKNIQKKIFKIISTRMLQTTLSAFRPRGSNVTGKVALATLGALTGYGAFYHYNQYLNLSARWQQIQENIAKDQPFDVDGFDAKVYPWVRENNVNDWEYKLVKMRGYFKDQRFFVRRKRDGKEGFLVFAPFVTAVERVNHRLKQKDLLPVEYSVFVNLGWVPVENKKDVELGGEVCPPMDAPTDSTLFVNDTFTGFNPDPANPEDTEQVTLTEITGIVRRGEQQDILARRRNWNKEGIYNWVDLDYMGKIFRLFNLDAINTAYIERVVPSFEEGEEGLYPIPATKDTFERPLNTPERHSTFFNFYAATSALSFISMLLLRR